MKLKKKTVYPSIILISIIAFFALGEKSLGLLIFLNILLAGIFLYDSLKKSILSIDILFVLNYLMYVLYIPIRLLDKSYNGEMFYDLSSDRLLASQVVLVCGIIALMAFISGKYLYYEHICNRKVNIKVKNSYLLKIKDKIRMFISKYSRIININTFSYFLILAGFSLFMIGIFKQGGLSYIFSKYIWNSDNIQEIGIMTTGVLVANSGIALAFYTFIQQKDFNLKMLLKWPISYIFIFLSAIKLIQGGRIQILMAALTLIAIYSVQYKNISLKTAFIIGIIGIVSLGYIGYYRDYKTLIPSDFGTMMKYILGGSASLEYFLNSYTIFTTMNVINVANISYLWGGTILDGLTFLIPRFVLPNKDTLLLTNNKIAELNSIEVISPVGGLNLAAQNLLNGNVIYTILFMLLIAIMIYWLTEYKNRRKTGTLLYCLVLPYIVISSVRNPIFYSIKEVIQFAIIPYLIYMFLSKGDQYEKNSI